MIKAIKELFETAGVNTLKGFGNILLNGFASDLSEKSRTAQIGTQLNHFNPFSKWIERKYDLIDESTKDIYWNDSHSTLRLKCSGLFFGSLSMQPIGLTLNLLNKVAKIATFAHLWNPSKEKYSFKARIVDWVKDLFLVIATPLILLGMIFASLYGMTFSPPNGKKLYASLERLIYSGGYHFFKINGDRNPNNFFLAPCFQPEATTHFFGGTPGANAY